MFRLSTQRHRRRLAACVASIGAIGLTGGAVSVNDAGGVNGRTSWMDLGKQP